MRGGPATRCEVGVGFRYSGGMVLTIELEQETDGRWIAEITQLNIVLYGESKPDAIARAQAAAREIVADRITHGELPPDSVNATFDLAA